MALTVLSGPVSAQTPYDDGLSAAYDKALRGKTVAFVPISLSFDIPQAYNLGLKRQAEKLGMNYVVRDPNFSVDQAVQAVNQLIAEKPDVMVVHPLDANAFDRLARKAVEAGIIWIWVNNKGNENGNAYVGGDHYLEARLQVKLAAKACEGKSGKIALIQPPPNTPSTITGTRGVEDELAEHPQLQLVAKQSANADANQARAVAATILKQHEDLCAFIGLWDGEDVGIPPAVEEAGKKGDVAVITTGAGNKVNACDKIEDGSYTGYVSYDVATQVDLINSTIVTLLQTKPQPGSTPFAVYNHPIAITADNMTQNSCWSMSRFEQPLD
ncbi:MAG: sugar ABC transporter substrate-binding protein [Rhizobiaceae bacterium]|nr:sugar ABC transporter substrate-binding protein [Rhizobiaceae bacterium]